MIIGSIILISVFILIYKQITKLLREISEFEDIEID